MNLTPENRPVKHEISCMISSNPAGMAQPDQRGPTNGASAPLPDQDRTGLAGSGALDQFMETARNNAKVSTTENTIKAYAADWKNFVRWCRRHRTERLGGRGIESTSSEAICFDTRR